MLRPVALLGREGPPLEEIHEEVSSTRMICQMQWVHVSKNWVPTSSKQNTRKWKNWKQNKKKKNLKQKNEIQRHKQTNKHKGTKRWKLQLHKSTTAVVKEHATQISWKHWVRPDSWVKLFFSRKLQSLSSQLKHHTRSRNCFFIGAW